MARNIEMSLCFFKDFFVYIETVCFELLFFVNSGGEM